MTKVIRLIINVATTRTYIYTVSPKKEDAKRITITPSNLNRFPKFFHHWTKKKIWNEYYIRIPPHLTYVATLLWES